MCVRVCVCVCARACACVLAELPKSLHSGKLTWNLKGGLLQIAVLFYGPVFRLNVSFTECTFRLPKKIQKTLRLEAIGILPPALLWD